MKLADRGMKRNEFRRIIKSSLKMKNIETDCFKGIAGLLDIIKTDGEWWVTSSLGKVMIASPNYQWLQIAPDHAKWWLTVMFDEQGKLIQYYFDIIKSRYISESGEPRFVDMYLDIVMMPDGRYEVLDRGELELAYRNGWVSEFDYRRALASLYELVGTIHNKEPFLRNICAGIMDNLKNM